MSGKQSHVAGEFLQSVFEFQSEVLLPLLQLFLALHHQGFLLSQVLSQEVVLRLLGVQRDCQGVDLLCVCLRLLAVSLFNLDVLVGGDLEVLELGVLARALPSIQRNHASFVRSLYILGCSQL